jgi:hypothetical protein
MPEVLLVIEEIDVGAVGERGEQIAHADLLSAGVDLELVSELVEVLG